MKKVLVLLLMAISLNSCGEGCGDCCLGDPCWDAGFGSINLGDGLVGGGLLDLSECEIKESDINISYGEKENDLYTMADLLLQERDQFETEYFDNYATYLDSIVVVFESEGGDLIELKEKEEILDEEINAKIIKLYESQDSDSTEWRDERTLLEIEIQELQLELYSAAGIETKALVSDLLTFIKESLLELNELEDARLIYLKYIDEEKVRLDEERQAAIEALNC